MFCRWYGLIRIAVANAENLKYWTFSLQVCRKKEKYLDIYTKVIPASRGSGVLDNLDIETTPLACPSQGYLKACQGASIMTSRPYKVFSSYYLVSQRISRYLPCHGRLGFPTLAYLRKYTDSLLFCTVAKLLESNQLSSAI